MNMFQQILPSPSLLSNLSASTLPRTVFLNEVLGNQLFRWNFGHLLGSNGRHLERESERLPYGIRRAVTTRNLC